MSSPSDSHCEELGYEVSVEMTTISEEIASFYSSCDDPCINTSPNSSKNNLHIKNLTQLFNEHCYSILDYAANVLQRNLDKYRHEALVIVRKTVLVATEFLTLPFVPLYFNKNIVKFLKNVIVDLLYDTETTLKLDTLIILIHFGCHNISKEDFCQLFSCIFKSVHSSVIMDCYKNYFKDFYFLFKNIICDINNKTIISNQDITCIKLMLEFSEINFNTLKIDIVFKNDTTKFYMYMELLKLLFNDQNMFWPLEGLTSIGSNFLANKITDLLKLKNDNPNPYFNLLFDTHFSMIDTDYFMIDVSHKCTETCLCKSFS